MNEQNESAEKKEKKEGQSTTFSPLAIVALLLFTLSESGDTGLVTILIMALMVGALVYVVYKGVSKMIKKRSGEGADEAASVSAATDTEQTEGPQLTTEEPATERERRMRQLDVWLENGTIDREEYQKLKDRYEGEQ